MLFPIAFVHDDWAIAPSAGVRGFTCGCGSRLNCILAKLLPSASVRRSRTACGVPRFGLCTHKSRALCVMRPNTGAAFSGHLWETGLIAVVHGADLVLALVQRGERRNGIAGCLWGCRRAHTSQRWSLGTQQLFSSAGPPRAFRCQSSRCDATIGVTLYDLAALQGESH